MRIRGRKTYIGLAAAGLVLLANTVGAEIPETVPVWMESLVGLGGVLFAWYGRYDKERRAPE